MTTKSQEAFESSRTKRMDFTHNGYSYHSSETQTEFEKFEDGRKIAAKIEALTQELSDSKQAARYETDVAQQAVADFEEAKGKIEELEKDAKRVIVENLKGKQNENISRT
jgi:hypothetical protein